MAANIRALVSSINDRYAATHGHDLFKATNKTATPQSALATPAASLAEYKQFIENLYFLFREGIGQRLDGKLPDSFRHVNDLRTALQHDVDHGKEGKAAKRRKELGEVFRIYSGAPSPDAVNPGQFRLIQTNILAALAGDLHNLAKSLI